MSDVFISYSRQDKERARALAETLEHHGYSVWWDRQIPPGRTFDEVIQEALSEAKCVIVLWSHSSVQSNWVKEEASYGSDRGVLLPIRLDPITVPLGFGRIQTADCSTWAGGVDDPVLDPVIGAVAVKLGRTTTFRTRRTAAPAGSSPSPAPPQGGVSEHAWERPGAAVESGAQAGRGQDQERASYASTTDEPAPGRGAGGGRGLLLGLGAVVVAGAVAAGVVFLGGSGSGETEDASAAVATEMAAGEAVTPPEPEPAAAVPETVPGAVAGADVAAAGDEVEAASDGGADEALRLRAEEMLATLRPQLDDPAVSSVELLARYSTFAEAFDEVLDEATRAEVEETMATLESSGRELEALREQAADESLSIDERLALWRGFEPVRSTPEIEEAVGAAVAELEALRGEWASVESEDDFVTCSGVDRNAEGRPTNPTGVSTRFPAGSVLAFVFVKAPRAEKLRLEWREDGAVVGTQSVSVQRSERYRFFYSKSFSSPGTKEVHLYSQAGHLIARRSFEITG